MIKRFKILFIAQILICISIQAQDLNQTNYRYAPLYLNPSHVGNFSGNIRVGGSYRSQYNTFIQNGYQTQQAFLDSPLAYGFRSQDWIGIGLHFFNDKAGDLGFKNTGALIGLSYHLAMDKKNKGVLSFGLQYGFSQRKIDVDNLVLETDYRTVSEPVDRNMLMDFNGNLKDLSIGLQFNAKTSKTSSVNVGLAVYHLLSPEFSGVVQMNNLNRRISLHTNYKSKVSKNVIIKPEIIVSLSKNALNAMPQFKSFYKLSKDKSKSDFVYAGVGYRIKDALQIMVGLNYKRWDVGISYDVTVSSANQYNGGRGGFELGLTRIFDIPKTPKNVPIILCPRL